MNDSEKPVAQFDAQFVAWLKKSIRWAVRVLAVLMMLVIWWGVADVIYVLVERMAAHPYMLLDISDILATFGAFMAVLIAIEIFVNIVSYLQEDVIHIKVVLATAFMAAARKVIVLDYKQTGAEYVYATAALVLALCVAYWLVEIRGRAARSGHDKVCNSLPSLFLQQDRHLARIPGRGQHQRRSDPADGGVAALRGALHLAPFIHHAIEGKAQERPLKRAGDGDRNGRRRSFLFHGAGAAELAIGALLQPELEADRILSAGAADPVAGDRPQRGVKRTVDLLFGGPAAAAREVQQHQQSAGRHRDSPHDIASL